MNNNHRLKYLFVINNGAGSKNNDAILEKIKAFIPEEDHEKSLYILPATFTHTQIKDHVIQTNPLMVVAVGGDGTVTMLANIAADKNILLGVILAGSANGMAKELGISENTDEALQIIKSGKQKKIDLIKINDKDYCLHLSDIGLNAHLIKHFDEGKMRGKLGYALVIFKTLWQKEKMQVTIHTEDITINRTAFMVAFANARMYGTGAVINPQGKLDDGLFEVIIVRKLSFFTLLKMMLDPSLFNPSKIEIISCTSVDIRTNRKVYFQIDGEYKGKIKNIHAAVKKGMVTMILPA